MEVPVLGRLSEHDMSMWIMYSVLANLVFYVLVLIFYSNMVKRVERQADEANVTPSDYSVLVRGLPRDATRDELVEHFSELYNLWKEDWVSATCCNGKSKRRERILPDNTKNRVRFRNAFAASKYQQMGFVRGTADPVLDVRHVIEPYESQEDALLHSESGMMGGLPGAQRVMPRRGEDPDATDGVGEAAGDLTAGEAGFMDGAEEGERLVEEARPLDMNEEGERLFGKWVADCVVAHPNGALLRRFFGARKLLASLEKETRRAAMLRAQGEPARAQLERQLKMLTELEERVHRTNDKMLDRYSTECVGAVITFNNEESYRRCVDDYEEHNHCCFGLPRPLRFRGKFNISVQPADEPDEIVWENFDVTDRARCIRQSIACTFVAILLLLSTAVIVSANGAKIEFLSAIPDVSVCQAELPALFYGGYANVPDDWKMVRNLAEASNCSAYSQEAATRRATAIVGDGWYGAGVGHVALAFEPAPSPAVNTSSAFAAAAGDPRCVAGHCFATDDAYTCMTIGSVSRPRAQFRASSVVGCYCIQQLTTAIAELGISGAIELLEQEDGDVCLEFVSNYALAQSFVVGAALIVVVVNIVLNMVLTFLTSIELHATRSDEVASLTSKVFLSQFLNTAVIVLLVNAEFPFVRAVGLANGVFGVFVRGHMSFVPNWYSAVGVGICITMLTSVVVPQVSSIVAILLRPTRFICARPVDDDETKALYALDTFTTLTKFPVLLNIVFVTLMYSSGMPVLYPIGMLAMLVTYWLDRCCLLRCLARPAWQDAQVARFTARTLPWSVFIHLAIAVYMLGDPSVVYSRPFSLTSYMSGASSAQDYIDGLVKEATQWDLIGIVPRIIRSNTFPIFAVLIVAVVLRLLYAILGAPFLAFLRRLFCCLSCGMCCRAPSSHEDFLNPPYAGEFYMPVPASKFDSIDKLNDESIGQLVDDDPYRGDGSFMLYRVWTAKDEAKDWRHKAGNRMLTWQVMQSRGLAHSYRLEHNPIYVQAHKAIVEGLAHKAATATSPRGDASVAASPMSDMIDDSAANRDMTLPPA